MCWKETLESKDVFNINIFGDKFISTEVETYWKNDEPSSLSEVVCEVGAETILLADIKTIQPSMTKKEISAMKRFKPHFTEVGWLNDKVKYLRNHGFFRDIIAKAKNNNQPKPLQFVQIEVLSLS